MSPERNGRTLLKSNDPIYSFPDRPWLRAHGFSGAVRHVQSHWNGRRFALCSSVLTLINGESNKPLCSNCVNILKKLDVWDDG